MRLYQREHCPSCRAAREHLGRMGLDYDIVSVPKLGSEREALLRLAGTSVVPVLVDGDTILRGLEAIDAHLGAKSEPGAFGDPDYGLTRTLDGMAFGDAVEATKRALAGEGFGVLTEIDMKATMKKKLDEDIDDYVILGACNPPLALQALSAEPAIGLLLPCNVVVAAKRAGPAVVSAIDPVKMFSVVGRDDIEPIARDVGDRLRRALAAV